MNELLIFGAGAHGKVVLDAVRAEGKFKVTGFLDDEKPRGPGFSGYEVLGGRERLGELFARGARRAVVAIGDNRIRQSIFEELEFRGFILTSIVHPFCSLASEVTIGAGTVVLAGAVVDPAVRVGKGNILNQRASLTHDADLRDFVHIGPAACIGPGTTIEAASLIGMGAIVMANIRIGEGALIGAGSVVTRDIPPASVVVGTPARPLLSREHSGHL